MKNWKNKDPPLIRTQIKVGSAISDTLLFNQVFFPVSWFKWYLKNSKISLSSETLKRLSLLSLEHSHKLKAS